MWRPQISSAGPVRGAGSDTSVLVTGGAGYIGSNTALALIDAGHRVVILDDLSRSDGALLPPQAEFVQGHVGDTALVGEVLRRARIGAVMHFAASISVAESVRDPALYYRNNLGATVELAATAAEAGVRAFIFSSTAAVYGEGDGTPLSEEAPLQPINSYGRSKAMAETALVDIAAAGGMGLGILRYFNAAGADPSMRSGQATLHPHHLIEIATQVATGARETLEIFGTDYPTPDGTAVRDYVHVHDIANAHLLLMHRALGKSGTHLYNVGTGEGASVRMVIDALAGEVGHPIPSSETGRRPGDPAVLVADSQRLRDELGWQPRYGLADIVRHALSWEKARQTMSSRPLTEARLSVARL